MNLGLDCNIFVTRLLILKPLSNPLLTSPSVKDPCNLPKSSIINKIASLAKTSNFISASLIDEVFLRRC